MLYIFWFLHQTTTREQQQYFCFWLYIFWFLHQTTTQTKATAICKRCISFDSYIKPQLDSYHIRITCVVYLLIPTSNHNQLVYYSFYVKLYIFWFLHQTTTSVLRPLLPLCCISFDSYIKPQPCAAEAAKMIGCISFDSYIKPQLQHVRHFLLVVVYLLIPTSNHNMELKCS